MNEERHRLFREAVARGAARVFDNAAISVSTRVSPLYTENLRPCLEVVVTGKIETSSGELVEVNVLSIASPTLTKADADDVTQLSEHGLRNTLRAMGYLS